MLTISNLTFRMQGRLLLEDVSAVIRSKDKVGLVGRNGAGKSTLFRLITGELGAESGSIDLSRGLRIGQVAQEAPGSDVSLIDTVLEADQERLSLLAEAEEATDPNRISEIHVRLADIDAHSAEARAGAILSGLGFSAADQQRPCKDFSGGWRMRVALAALLFSKPDLLLLDEPTNYLDLEGTLWLKNFLSRYPYTVVIISHDRDLLNSACQTIIHLENLKLTTYRGNYDTFERNRSEKLTLLTKMKAKQDAKRAHMEAFINRFKAKASKATQAQSRVKALQKMANLSVVQEKDVQPLSFPSPEKLLSSPIINLSQACVGYEPGKPILKGINLRLDNDDRIALLGANGNGKSTFAKLLSGRLEVMSGTMTRPEKLRVAFFAQHNLDDLVAEQTAVDHVRQKMSGEKESVIRTRTAQMGLDISKMDTKARDLSGGEKARLLLGLATFERPHLLILDEPTNHLDIETRESLILALSDYSGAVLLISHDQHLVEATAERLWLVQDGSVSVYDGNLTDYRKLVLKGRTASTDDPNDKKPITSRPNTTVAAEKRREAADERHRTNGARKRVKQLEAIMNKAEAAIATLDEQLATASTEGRVERIEELAKKKSEFERRLVEVEEEWLDLSAQLEA